MCDEMQNRILNATMMLIMDKGYTATTTKDIAKAAGVNECTIFRKFKSKKDIVVEAMALPAWNPCLKESDFKYIGEMEKDLCSFAEIYLKKVTPKMVKISLGLRTPDLYEVTRDGVRAIPDTFKKVLIKYFTEMQQQEKVYAEDVENLAVEFLALNFGFVFFKASFGDELTEIQTKEYIEKSVHHFINGICK